MEETSASQSRPNNNNNNTQRIPLPPPPQSIHLNNHNNPHRSLPLPPPPSQANYNSLRPPQSSSSSKPSFRGCCCCLILLFSFIALLTLSIILTIILAIKPKKPQFNLQQVAVQYMGITSPNLFSSSSLSTTTTTTTDTAVSATASLSINIKLMFTASNPNKVGIKYKESKFTVMYRGIPLGKARVRGFYQEAYSEREVEAVIDVERVNLMQADASEIVRDASLNDRVELRVLGDVGANIRLLDLDSPPLQVSVDCSIVISPRNQSLTYKQCGFDGLNL